ncbi:hypothetical protein NKI72_31300 [Mesorhizobium sp. M0437]|uniref:hypothetical protein n=1 Tax=Mesorhizobium sp. M0437 TaxID=2956945 RepID=UPI00333AFE3A
MTVYILLVAVWSCPYADDRLVIGSTLTSLGAKFLNAHPSYSCKELIASAIGRTNDIWDSSELMVRFILMTLAFFISLIGCSTATVAALQLLRITKVDDE